MGKAANYASTHKSRLIALGAIDESDEGALDFAIPMLRGYLGERLSRPARPPSRPGAGMRAGRRLGRRPDLGIRGCITGRQP